MAESRFCRTRSPIREGATRACNSFGIPRAKICAYASAFQSSPATACRRVSCHLHDGSSALLWTSRPPYGPRRRESFLFEWRRDGHCARFPRVPEERLFAKGCHSSLDHLLWAEFGKPKPLRRRSRKCSIARGITEDLLPSDYLRGTLVRLIGGTPGSRFSCYFVHSPHPCCMEVAAELSIQSVLGSRSLLCVRRSNRPPFRAAKKAENRAARGRGPAKQGSCRTAEVIRELASRRAAVCGRNTFCRVGTRNTKPIERDEWRHRNPLASTPEF